MRRASESGAVSFGSGGHRLRQRSLWRYTPPQCRSLQVRPGGLVRYFMPYDVCECGHNWMFHCDWRFIIVFASAWVWRCVWACRTTGLLSCITHFFTNTDITKVQVKSSRGFSFNVITVLVLSTSFTEPINTFLSNVDLVSLSLFSTLGNFLN